MTKRTNSYRHKPVQQGGADFVAYQRHSGRPLADGLSLDDPTTGFLKIKNKDAAPEENPFAQRFDIFIAKHVSAGG